MVDKLHSGVCFLNKHKQLFIFLLFMSVFRSAIADWYTVPSGSMQPTIQIGDRIVVNKMAYDLRLPFTDISLVTLNTPKHGEIIVFESKAANLRLIKRIIGLPGDVVSMHNDTIIVNDKPLTHMVVNDVENQSDTTNANIYSEKIGDINHFINVDNVASIRMSSFYPITVPEGHYLVLGDNRRHSSDSRAFGFVPHHELRGKASAIAFSVDYDNYLIPRKARFFKNIYAHTL